MAKTMKYFYDCEFLEDGFSIDLISIGMACEDGRTYYAVSSEFDTRRISRHNWLMENVMSSIDHEESISYMSAHGSPVKDLTITDPALRSRRQIRDDILEFTAGTWPEFWAWYGAYDHVALCQLFGTMVELPSKFPMFTADIKQLHKKAGSPEMPQQPEGLHNALADAQFNIVRYEFLTDLLNGETTMT
jgi:hypothetical protein